ncbi:MAG: methyltransferase [Gillisia sp.]
MEDKVGRETLEIIASADNFNKWMFETILPHSHGKILEIGSGIGNISSQFLQQNFSLMLSDLRTEYCTELENRFKKFSNFLGVEKIDLIDPEFDTKFRELFETFNTVFALNVVEHIEDDELAIKNCRKLLKSKGTLIILVPSYQNLYNNLDKELGHYRRYTIEKLEKLFLKNNLNILHCQYFNATGMLGWYFSGKILKKKSIPKGQMFLYNKLVPIFRILDRGISNRIGLSTIVVGRK